MQAVVALSREARSPESQMTDRDPAQESLLSARDPCPSRRALLLASLAALPFGLAAGRVRAAKLDPSETIITLPEAIRWTPWSGAPPHSAEMATLYGNLDAPGPYLVLMKWYPGYMSAPH
jgi:hypothetical protein